MVTFKFAIGDHVQKQGAGYSGPGVVVAAFPGVDDNHPRYVVGHRVQGGRGVFYHIYGEGQLSILPAEEEDDT
jgi:hypothetical protein